jgi:Tol biopolymer transport system component
LRSAGGGCQLNWSGDGQELLCVDKGKRGGNAIFRVDPQTLERKLLLDVEGSHSHEYFPRLSQDQRWLVFAASESGHEHDTADYEIFLWRTNGAMDAPIRLTYHTANDNWPDIHLKADKD